MEIRKIGRSELGQLLDLYTHLHVVDDPLPSVERIHAVWEQILADPAHCCFGVFVNGKLVASCVLVVIPNLTRGCRPHGVIENVVTHSDYRRRGFAKAMLHHALDYAWQQGCFKVMLLSGRKNEATDRLYESVGFDRHAKQGFLARPSIS